MSALAMTYEGACLEGMNSSTLEHSVPEQMFSTADNPVYGVSAVKAIQIAASQGIPIYTVTRENADTVIPQLSLDAATIQEIQNAVNAGNEVTTSRTNINFHGWQGCGYIVMNPVTGTGAYMISGQESGALIQGFSMFVLSFTAEFYGFTKTALALMGYALTLLALFVEMHTIERNGGDATPIADLLCGPMSIAGFIADKLVALVASDVISGNPKLSAIANMAAFNQMFIAALVGIAFSQALIVGGCNIDWFWK